MATLEEMDIAAEQAAVELDQIPTENLHPIIQWWVKWFKAAGYKRLGRLLVSKRGQLPDEGE